MSALYYAQKQTSDVLSSIGRIHLGNEVVGRR